MMITFISQWKSLLSVEVEKLSSTSKIGKFSSVVTRIRSSLHITQAKYTPLYKYKTTINMYIHNKLSFSSITISINYKGIFQMPSIHLFMCLFIDRNMIRTFFDLKNHLPFHRFLELGCR
jgi:hypothetical protein